MSQTEFHESFLEYAIGQFFIIKDRLGFFCCIATLGWVTVKLQKKLEILHYKAFRVAVRDYERLFHREMLGLLGKQKPNVIDNYMTGSVFINCYL